MGKTTDLFKKIRDTKGTFHAKMSSIKDRNGMDLTEEEDIKKRWQEYTEELYKKDLHDPDNHDGVITDLEPDILECEVKWALESITTGPQGAIWLRLGRCLPPRSRRRWRHSHSHGQSVAGHPAAAPSGETGRREGVRGPQAKEPEAEAGQRRSPG